MNKSNYTVCNKCGSANPVSARFCYQCGNPMKKQDAPVTCLKCSTVNIGTANFCKRCGARLEKVLTKQCPKCNTINPMDAAFCPTCRFDFNATAMPRSAAYSEPAPQPQRLTKKEQKQQEKQAQLQQEERARQAKLERQLAASNYTREEPKQKSAWKTKSKKRDGFARLLILSILAIAFVFFAVFPGVVADITGADALDYKIADLTWDDTRIETNLTPSNAIASFLEMVSRVIPGVNNLGLKVLKIGKIPAVMGGILLLNLFSMAVYLICWIVRMISGKNFTKGRRWLLILAIGNTFAVALIFGCNAALAIPADSFWKFIRTAASWLLSRHLLSVELGIASYVLVGGSWLMYILSVCFKSKKRIEPLNVGF